MKKFNSDELHSFIMAYMLNNNMDEMIIRPPNDPPATSLHLHFFKLEDEKGSLLKIKLEKGLTSCLDEQINSLLKKASSDPLTEIEKEKLKELLQKKKELINEQ